ncbi:hypothetical protein [Desulfocicer niacini]
MAQQGIETGSFGEWLTDYLKSTPGHGEYTVYFDHGSDKQKYPNVVAPKAFYGNEVSNLNRLADLDVMVVRPDGKVDLVIEIEERPSSPKKILGDVLALVLSNSVATKTNGKQKYFKLCGKTELVVAGIQPGKGRRLRKMSDVIEPRLQSLGAPSDSISPQSIRLLFEEEIEAVLSGLRRIVQQKYPGGKIG